MRRLHDQKSSHYYHLTAQSNTSRTSHTAWQVFRQGEIEGREICERVRRLDREWGRDREPEGGWGGRRRWSATCCETSKSKLSPTLYDLSPPTNPIILLLFQSVMFLDQFWSKIKLYQGWRLDLREDGKRTGVRLWRCASCFYGFTFLYLSLSLSQPGLLFYSIFLSLNLLRFIF